jgi:hypothetical protein
MTEIMGERVWQIAPFKGKTAVLEIVDHLQGPWGHLVLDDIVQWVQKPAAAPVPAGTQDASDGLPAAPTEARAAPVPAHAPERGAAQPGSNQ